MSVKRRGETVDGKWVENGDYFYRFTYKGKDFCEGGFRTSSQAGEAERLAMNKAVARILHPDGNDGVEAKQITIEEAIEIYLRLHGASLPGGVSLYSRSRYYSLKCHLGQLQKAWGGKHFDTITHLDVRDFMQKLKTVGTRMRYLGVISGLYNRIKEWNDDPNILPEKVSIPPYNPATRWRRITKAADKRELPRTRVLTPDEWFKFRPHLLERTRQICEIALRRFLRLGDIKQISFTSVKNHMIEGLQGKTGGEFSVPMMTDHPQSYDFTNFKREFKAAQVSAGMDYPVKHPLHFMVRDLRRTGATWAYHKTKDLRSIQKMLGHSKLSTTERYLHVSDENLQEIASVMDALSTLQQNCNGVSHQSPSISPKVIINE